MAVENAKKFINDLNENEELKEKLKKELEAFKDSGKKEKELIPEIARKLGYDFTEEELKKEYVNDKELSYEELSNVSGGYLGFDEDAPDGHELTCIFAWYHCGWKSYYWINNICENCQSKNGHRDGSQGPFICNDCGHYTNNPQGDSGLE
ncbi:nif11-like leader peptide domain-containing protein [Eubacterium ruminantium]|nr:nif11-like leader peptide domain-containing protein [Eubacterium ruminantium]